MEKTHRDALAPSHSDPVLVLVVDLSQEFSLRQVNLIRCSKPRRFQRGTTSRGATSRGERPIQQSAERASRFGRHDNAGLGGRSQPPAPSRPRASPASRWGEHLPSDQEGYGRRGLAEAPPRPIRALIGQPASGPARGPLLLAVKAAGVMAALITRMEEKRGGAR